MWEGGTRVVAAIYSPLIKSPQRVSNEFMHVTDLLPTLTAAANISFKDSSIDGVNQWNTISSGVPTSRQEILYNIENVFGYSAVMKDGWKLVNGTDEIEYSNWFGSSGTENGNFTFESYASKVLNSDAAKSLPELSIEKIRKLRDEATVKCEKNTKAIACNPLIAPCLFNILDDPCEQNNLADSHSPQTEYLIKRLDHHIKEMLPSRRRFSDVNCDPANFNYTWTWWQEDEIESKRDSEIILIAAICILLAVAFTSFLFAKFSKKTGSLKIMSKK